MSNIELLKNHVDKLQKLLADPHPGLTTWLAAYGNEMSFISDFWNADPQQVEKQDAEPERCSHEFVLWTPGVTGTDVKIGNCLACGEQIERSVA